MWTSKTSSSSCSTILQVMGSVLNNVLESSATPGASETREKFSCKEEPIENQRPLKVRVIGAGFSGVYLGIRIPQRLRNIDLKIYEKNDGLGGTWWENRYPGCACDIPGEYYSLLGLDYRSSQMSQTDLESSWSQTLTLDSIPKHIRTSSPSSRTRDGPGSMHRPKKFASTSRRWQRSTVPIGSSSCSTR